MSTKIKSTFALLDVMDGREELFKRIEAGEMISVTITGKITSVWGIG